MLNSDVVSALAGVSSLLGLLAIIGYFYYNVAIRRTELSVRRAVEDEGMFDAQRIVEILAQFKGDEQRLKALQELTNYGSRQTEAFLQKVKKNVDLNRLNRGTQRQRRRALIISATVFLGLAALGLIYAFFSSPLFANSPPASSIPDPLSQEFSHRIGDDSSCTEENVTRRFDMCFTQDVTVTNWTNARYISRRNGSAAVALDPARPNCAVMTLQYSDSGRGPFGDCRGNGWVEYALTLNGTRSK